jgi:thioredoxin 1
MTASELHIFDEQTFDEEVLRAQGPVLVEFWNDGCVPCRQLRRVLTQLASDVSPEIRIGTVNANENPDLAERYGIRGVPSLLFFKNGAVVETRTGVDRRQVIKKLAEAHV